MLPPFDLADLLDGWLQPLVAALGAIAIALLLFIALRPLVVRLTRHSATMRAIVKRLDRPLRWTLPLIALQVVWENVSDHVDGIERVRHLNSVLLIVALTMTAIAIVRGIVDAVGVLHPQDVADNLRARRVMTQTRVLSRILIAVIAFAGLAFVLMTFPKARQFGASLLASAGLSALVVGLAARSVFSNLLAGIQIALSQPIRIDDVLIVQGEWGRVEEITGTYVVLKIWDERRLVIPLQWFIENPFQNWTRSTSDLIGSVFFWVDYTTDLGPLRDEANRLAKTSPDYDGRVCLLQVVETSERAMQLRLIVSSPSAGQSWDLRCLMREGLIDFMRRHQPESLPRMRAEVEGLPPMVRPSSSKPLPGTRPDVAAPRPGEALVNDGTGMASLASPTGGFVPEREAPR